MRWARHEERVGEMRNALIFWSGNLKEYTGVGKGIILKRITQTQ
jgi:hypothetical protein